MRRFAGAYRLSVEARRPPRYGWPVEERSSWLPPGLESPGLEPDDRASQGGWRKPKRGSKPGGRSEPLASAADDSDAGKSESGEAKKPAPYDHAKDEPEPPERDRSEEAEEEPADEAEDEPAAEADDEPEADDDDEPQAEEDDEPEAEADDEPEAEEDDEPEAEEEPGDEPADEPEPEAEAEENVEPARSWDEEPEEPEEPQRRRREPDRATTVDAMGQDKHRKVIGQRYGASRSKQLLYYGIFIAVVIGGYLGLKAAADQLDKAPAHDPDKAPWSRPGAPQAPLGGFETGRKGPTKFQ